VDGIRVTTRPRTVVDLAAQLAPSAYESMFDEVLVHRLVRLDDVEAEYDRLVASHGRGLGLVGEVLWDRHRGQPPSSSQLERALSRLLRDPKIPPSCVQSAFPWWPSQPFRVDALIPSWRRIVEADGRLWHTREADFERDRWRDHLSQRHGYEVTRFTHRQLVATPEYALDALLDIDPSHKGREPLAGQMRASRPAQ
jgi:very-short-patch-repair endonuclease